MTNGFVEGPCWQKNRPGRGLSKSALARAYFDENASQASRRPRYLQFGAGEGFAFDKASHVRECVVRVKAFPKTTTPRPSSTLLNPPQSSSTLFSPPQPSSTFPSPPQPSSTFRSMKMFCARWIRKSTRKQKQPANQPSRQHTNHQ